MRRDVKLLYCYRDIRSSHLPVASDLFGNITFAISRFSICRSESELSPVKSKHLKAMKQGKLSWGNPGRKLK